MEVPLKNFYKIIEKKYLPNGEKDKSVGTEVIFNILEQKVNIKKCESIFIKSLALLALNNNLTTEKIRRHLIFSKSIDLFNETQFNNFCIFLKKIQELATQGKGASQITESSDNSKLLKIATEAKVRQESTISKFILGAIILGILMTILTFYWYQIRPSNIRKNCYSEVSSSYPVKYTSKAKFEFLYETCLAKYGITQ